MGGELRLSPATRARRGRRAQTPALDELEAPVGERRLARLVRTLAGEALVAHLAALPLFERRQARLVLIRELGPTRAGAVYRRAYGAGGEGAALPAALRARLDDVVGPGAALARLHDDAAAAALAAAHRARALTIGEHVFFDAGEYQPETIEGVRLIAHEVAHVEQWRRGALGAEALAAKGKDGGVVDAAEAEADLRAELAVAKAPTPKPAPPLAPPGSGLTEDEAQRAAQLAVQARQLAAAKPSEPAPAAAAPPDVAPVASPPPAPPPAASTPAPAAAPRAASNAFVALFSAPPSQQASEWSAVGAKASAQARADEAAAAQLLPQLPARLDGKAQTPSPAASAVSAKSATLAEPPAAAAPALTPKPAPTPAPLPKNPAADLGVKVPNEDKAAVESAGKQALDQISTKDPVPPRKPGPAPVIELCGEADPVRTAAVAADGVKQAEAQRAAEAERIARAPGAAAVQPRHLDEKLRVAPPEAPGALPSPPAIEEMAQLRGWKLDAASTQAFDEVAKPQLEARLASARAQVESADTQRASGRREAIADSQHKAEAANREAAQRQASEVQTSRAHIVAEQKSTLARQQAATDEVKRGSQQRRSEALGQIDARAKADQEQIGAAYKDADAKAQAEHQRGEAEAKQKKETAKQQSKDKSWWQRAKAAVCDAIAAIANAVNQILAAVRDAINKLIDGVKQLACRLIEAARDFIKSAISAFGAWLKSAVTGLLGQLFPALAAKLVAFIDRAVAAARRAVDAVADGLKKAVTALCDALKKAVSALIAAWQAAVKAAAALATALVSGDWKAVARMVLEAILKAIGVDPKAFWALIAKAEGSLKKILDNPRAFVGNLMAAAKNGFALFAQNLWTHLKNGLVAWLVNSLSSAGVTMPAKLDFAGVFDLTLQVLGLTRDKLRQKVAKLVGEKNAARLDKVWALVEPLVKGGMAGLWAKVQQDLAGLEQAIMTPIKDFLVEKVVKAAVLKIASLFNPAGAIAQLILTAWNVYCWLRDNAARIFGLVQAVVDSIAEIVDGKLDKAAKLVEQSLAKSVPIAIDFAAQLLGLGGVGAKIHEILGRVHKRIDDAIDKFLQKLIKQGGGDKKDEKDDEAARKETGEGKEVKQQLAMDGEAHTLTIRPGKQGSGPVDFEMASLNPGPIRSKIASAIRLAVQQEKHGNTPEYRKDGVDRRKVINTVRDLVFALDKAIKPLTTDIQKRVTDLKQLHGSKLKSAHTEVTKLIAAREKKTEQLTKPIAEKLIEIGKAHKLKSLEDTGETARDVKYKMTPVPVPVFVMDYERFKYARFFNEYQRQVRLQMQGINAMTVEKWRDNREKFGKRKEAALAKAAADGTNPKRATGRSDEGAEMQKDLQTRVGGQVKKEGDTKSGSHKSGDGSGDRSGDDSQAALHNPDQIAGGPPDPNAMGSLRVNSALGPAWRGKRVGSIQDAVDKFKEKPERLQTQMNVVLTVTTKGTALPEPPPQKDKK